jgi:hypothetical protein
MLTESSLQSLTDLVCTSSSAQPETGNDLQLKFSARESWTHADFAGVTPNLGGLSQNWTLLLLCAWRVDSDESPICDWCSVTNEDLAPLQRHRILEGKRIVSVKVTHPGLDLEIHFSDSLRLSILCDSEGASGSWYLENPMGYTLEATNNFRLVSSHKDMQ